MKIKYLVINIIKKLKRKKSFDILTLKLLSQNPVSRVFGYDRGVPIDRYYIEKFLEENKNMGVFT